MCGKKAGSKIEEIRLDTTNGKFTVPRRRSTRVDEIVAAKTLVEFKGKHTRFPDDDDENLPRPSNSKARRTKLEVSVLEKGESSKTGVVTLKLYENKRKLFKPDSEIKQHVLNDLPGKLVEETVGSRGELLVTIRPSNEIHMNTLTEFFVHGCSKVCYFSRVI
jgi:hypothetical protein